MRVKGLACLATALLPFSTHGFTPNYSGYIGRKQASFPIVQNDLSCISSESAMAAKREITAAGRVCTEADVVLKTQQAVSELIVIDAQVPDKHLFYKQVKPGVELVEIDSDNDGLEQLLSHLKNYQSLDAIHVVSHADSEGLLLGQGRINSQLLQNNIQAFNQINHSVKPGGDILFYGCELAAGGDGETLLDLIKNNTHVDVAASNDLTGNDAKGGDWELEIKKGQINEMNAFSKLALKDFSDVLAPVQYVPNDFCTGGGCSTAATSHTSSDGHVVFSGSHNVYAYDGLYADSGLYLDYGTTDTAGHLKFAADGSNIASFELTAVNFSAKNGASCSTANVVGYLVGGGTQSDSFTLSGSGSVTLTNLSGQQITEFRVVASGCNQKVYWPIRLNNFSIDNKMSPADSDGSVSAGSGVAEPISLSTTVDSVGEAVDVFDFTLTDGGTADGLTLGVSQIVLNTSGTGDPSKVTWRLSGPDATNVTGSYSANQITFTGLSISVADGASETYTVDAFYSDNTSLTEGQTYILSVDGDTDLTVSGSGTQMGSTSAVTNSTGSTVEVTATALVFSTQPAASVSGSSLTTQPVVTARDAFGNTDTDFTETVTLTEASAGTLSGNTVAASSGVATFSAVAYTATADQQSFTLTANDQDGVGSNLPTTNANAVTSDVVATKLIFSTEPAPTIVMSGDAMDFSTDPVVHAVDAADVVDTGYSTGIVLSEVNGAGAATMTATGDTDGSGNTVTITPSSGVATYTNLNLTYTNSGGGSETFNLRASSGGLTTADSTLITSQSLSITSATYNYATGDLVVTGAGFQANAGAANDVDVSLLTLTGEGGGTHTITSVTNVEISSATEFTVTLTGTDKLAVDGLLNMNGTQSDDSTTYNLAAADDFMTSVTAGDTSDTTGNGVTVSGVTAPTVTSATYNAGTGLLTVTGTGFVSVSGANNEVDVSTLTLTGEGGATYALTSSDVEVTNATTFSVTLNATDKTAVNQMFNKDGIAATGGQTYNLAAADDWMLGAATSTNIADLTSNGITVSNVPVPTITSATYNASTGALVVTGTDFLSLSGATNDIVANKFTLTGEGGATYALTDTADVEISSATAFTLSLSATDKAGINQILNKNGVSSTGATTYNLNAAEDWAAGADAAVNVVDATGNGITVSNVAAPTITSATYDASSGALVVTGTSFLSLSGATNDIVANKFTFTGEGGATYALTDTADVEIISATGFTLSLSATDKAGVNQILNKNGASSTGATTYNLAAAEDWAAGADAAVNVADATGNGITVSNVAVPTITSATYDASSGALVVTGTDFFSLSGVTNDIVANKFTFTGEGGTTYTLTDTANVEITSATAFTLSLSATDKAEINQILNKNGTASTGSTTYNLNATEDWAAGVDAAVNVADATGNGITVSNVAVPTITSATYDASSGALVVTGTDFFSLSGATNDIVANKFTFTGEGGTTYVLTDTANVEITSATAFTLSLSATDKAEINQILNKNGTSSTGSTTYNLSAAEDWAAGADAAVNVVDATGNGITVSNVAAPTITSATYDASSGALVVTATGLLKLSGATNDIVANKFTLTGEGGTTYALTDTANVEISSATEFTLTLSATDKGAINQIVNKNGTVSTGGTTYNLAAAEDWSAGADAAVNVVDASNALTASNVAAPTITSATYDYATNVLAVSGSGLLKRTGGTNDIDVSTITVTGEAGNTYTLVTSSDVEISSGTGFSVALTGADIFNVETLLNNNGTTSATSGTTYNVAAGEDWNIGADSAVTIADATGNGITVSNYAAPTVTSATYDWSTGQLVITATDLVNLGGAANDVDASQLTLTGEGGSYTLTNSSDVELSSSTSATLTLSATDQLAVHGVLNKNGTASSSATTYNLGAADNWVAGSPIGVDISDLTGNSVTVSNVCAPNITSATYDADSGVVTVTGSCFFKQLGAANYVDVSAFTFTGGVGNATYQLTSTTDIEISSTTSFSFTLSGSDKTNVDALLDQLGASSSGGSTYNIAAAEDWMPGADAAQTIADATNAVTVAVNPQIDSATYNASTGVLVVTGTNIQDNGGGADIDASLLTFTGEGGSTYTLTDTADVNRDSITQFTLTLSATDKSGVNALLNNAGTSSADATTYNLAAADDWDTNVTAGDTSDLTGNSITVDNTKPTLTGLAGDSVNYGIGASGAVLDNGTNVSLTDLSSPDFSGGNVTVSVIANAQAGEDVLQIATAGAISTSGSNVVHSDSSGITIASFTGGSAGADLVISLNSDATPARVQDLLRALQYSNSDAGTTNTLARTVRITVDDGDGGSSTSDNQDVTVNLIRAPIIDLDGDDSSDGSSGAYLGSFVEDSGVVAVADSDPVISDDGTFKSLKITLTNRPDGTAESLSSAIGTGAQTVNSEAVTIAAYNSGTGELLISVDDASTDAVTMQQLIASIRYDNASDVPDTANRAITFEGIDDADNTGPAATATISVAGANDAHTGAVTISGTAMQHQSLTAENTLADADGLGTFSYQWKRGGSDISGATSSSYTLVTADIGQTITVTISYTDGQGNAESSTSTATAAVAGDLDGDTIADGSDSDIDGDGMLNTYEDANGLDKLNSADRDTDLDSDGISNYDESVAGKQANADDNPPVVTAPADVSVNASGLLTAVTIGDATALDAKDGSVDASVTQMVSNGGAAQTLTISPTHFNPGVHVLTWTATDAAGNSGSATQTINVTPMVELSKNQTSSEGATATFKLILNGKPVVYPVSVPYTLSGTAAVDGSDHNLVNGTVDIVAPNLEATVTVNLVDDGAGEGDEAMIVTLGTPTSAVKGPASTHTLTIVEGNVVPLVSLASTQAAISTRIATQGGGDVLVAATATDANAGDVLSYDWSASDNALSDTDSAANSFTFDPTNLSAGLYTLVVSVSDGTATVTEEIQIKVIETAPVLGATDSDGDGTDDATEGFGDSDADGVPDYLDHADISSNVIQEKTSVSDQFLMETEPGLALKLGDIALRADNNNISVDEDDISAYANDGEGATADTGYAYDGGLFDFRVNSLPEPGQSISVVLPQFAQIPSEAIYRKLMPTGWQDFVIDANNQVASAAGAEGYCPPPGDAAYVTGLTEGHWCVQLTIEDGGPNDADGTQNGSVEDPGGVGQRQFQTVNYTITGDAGGGAASQWALLLLGLLVAWRRLGKRMSPLICVPFMFPGAAVAEAMEDLKPDYAGISYFKVKSQERGSDFQAELTALSLNATVTQTDLSRSGSKLFLGYQVEEKLALEFGYVDLGSVTTSISGTAVDVDSYLSTAAQVFPTTAAGWTFDFVLTHPLNDSIKALAKMGAFLWEADYSLTTNTATRNFEEDGFDASVGFGVEINSMPNIPIRLGWNGFRAAGITIKTWELGMAYRF